MPGWGDLLLAEGGASGDRALASGIQHAAAPFGAGIQAASAGGARNGRGKGLWKRRFEENRKQVFLYAWKSRKRRGIPTFPQPRRRRFIFVRGPRMRNRGRSCRDFDVDSLTRGGTKTQSGQSATSNSTRSFTWASADDTVCEILSVTGVPSSRFLTGFEIA